MEEYVAAVQMDCRTGEIKENSAGIIRLLKRMKQEELGIVLAVFPEMILYGYEQLEQISVKTSQNEIDECLKGIGAECKRLGINAVIGAPYFGTAGLENALYFLNTEGTAKHVYSKQYLIESERDVFAAGNSYGICETSFGRLGFLVCWDSAFPEAARAYGKAGVDFMAVSAAWEAPYGRQWELAVCGRSFDNDIPVIAANRIGKSGELYFAGRSMITDCLGNILTEEAEEKEGYIIADLEQLRSKEKRKGFGSQIEELKSTPNSSKTPACITYDCREAKQEPL